MPCSLAAAIRKSDNILTKLTMKKNELARLAGAGKAGKDKAQSFAGCDGCTVCMELGQQLPDDLTLSRYNEL